VRVLVFWLLVHERESVCVCAFACVREKERLSDFEKERERVRVCVCVCEREKIEREREREREIGMRKSLKRMDARPRAVCSFDSHVLLHSRSNKLNKIYIFVKFFHFYSYDLKSIITFFSIKTRL
jgi:hypothetical protein